MAEDKKAEIRKLEEEIQVVIAKGMKAWQSGNTEKSEKYNEDLRGLQARLAGLKYPEGIAGLEEMKKTFNDLNIEKFLIPWYHGRDTAPGEIISRIHDGKKYRLVVRIGKA